jgi:hypothetical protein
MSGSPGRCFCEEKYYEKFDGRESIAKRVKEGGENRKRERDNNKRKLKRRRSLVWLRFCAKRTAAIYF